MNAGFLLRLKAFLIDYIFILGYLIVVVVIGLLLPGFMTELFNGSLVIAQMFSFLMVTLPVSGYFILTDSVIGQGSVGKRIMKIQVVNRYGDPLTVPHATIRTFLKFLPWEMSHFMAYRMANLEANFVPIPYYFLGGFLYVFIFAYILTTIFSKKKQSLYDLFVGSFVVKRQA